MKLSRALNSLPNLFRALGLVWAASRGWTIAWLVLLVVQGLLPAATVYLTRTLVDGLAAAVAAGGDWAALGRVLAPGLLMAGLLLLGQSLAGVAGWVRTTQGELVKDHVTSLVHRQSIRLDLAFYDSPDYYDQLHRARSEASYRPVSLLESLGGLLQHGITLVAMAAIMLPYGAWLPITLLASTLPALYVVVHYRASEHRFWLGATPDVRRTWYYDWLLTARETAAELRLFGQAGRYQAAYQDLRRQVRTAQLHLSRNETLARVAAGALALVVTGGALLYMVWRAVRGSATLGDLALFYAAFNQGQGLMRSLLENLGQIYGNSLFLGDLFAFLALEPQVADPIRTAPAGAGVGPRAGPAVCFERVTFSYHGSTDGRPVLKDLDLTVGAGQVAAIVGPNGTGKTTLIKLLCRFYDPQAGRVTLDGVDLRDISLETLRKRITVLFQEPVRYSASLNENIALDRPDEPREAVEAAARAAGADVVAVALPQGYDTLLGTRFEDGTELSVGEWQRVALARAFLRQAQLVILDEPTSAMDPWAEAEWLNRLRSLVSGRTAIIITHRFTTARYADVIHVMDAGRIVETGTHDELLALSGSYARSWQAQMGRRAGVAEDEAG